MALAGLKSALFRGLWGQVIIQNVAGRPELDGAHGWVLDYSCERLGQELKRFLRRRFERSQGMCLRLSCGERGSVGGRLLLACLLFPALPKNVAGTMDV